MKTFNFYKNISALIQTRRNHSHVYMSQAVLARLLGYDNAQFISNIERGQAGIPFKKLETLARVLNIKESEIKAAILKDTEEELDYYFNLSKNMFSQNQNRAVEEQ